MDTDAATIARRNQASAHFDSDDRLYRLYYEVISGLAMRDSSLDLSAEERKLWREIEQSMRTNPAPEGTHYDFDVD